VRLHTGSYLSYWELFFFFNVPYYAAVLMGNVAGFAGPCAVCLSVYLSVPRGLLT